MRARTAMAIGRAHPMLVECDEHNSHFYGAWLKEKWTWEVMGQELTEKMVGTQSARSLVVSL